MDKFKILQTFYMCVFHSSKKAINMHKGWRDGVGGVRG
jgi:hypothetical protein